MAWIWYALVLSGCGGSSTPAAPDPPEKPAPAPAAAPAPAVDEVQVVEPGPGDVKKGEAVYQQYCQACHQADGSGLNGMLAANFKEDGRLDKTDAELLGSIANGFQGKVAVMPPWGSTLTDQEMRDALAYVRATFGE